ncbi:hypothetical protein WMF31_15795 [Sorangium sp. So ce1036]|uniref:hypothetical protein n=1 Tax=Sorangium sp. So ce1036 TaxID=3133328 RepID=UPI003F0BE02F
MVFAVVAGGALLDCDGGRHRARSSDTTARHDPDAADRQASVARTGWPALRAARPAELCVTSGAIRPVDWWGFAVDHPMTRAVLTAMTPPAAALRFRYDGPTADSAPLDSGELRRQIGLKLRSQDGCNVVYVMWTIEPSPRLWVTVKQNPGKQAYAECGANGYRNIKPHRSAPVPALTDGGWHVLRADLRGTALEVVADGILAWEGSLDQSVLSFDGPVGLRTDNGRFTVEFYASATPGAAPPPSPGSLPARCASAEGD